MVVGMPSTVRAACEICRPAHARRERACCCPGLAAAAVAVQAAPAASEKIGRGRWRRAASVEASPTLRAAPLRAGGVAQQRGCDGHLKAVQRHALPHRAAVPVVKAPGRRGEKRARPRRDASPLEREGRRRRHVARPAGLAPPPQHSRIAHTSTPPRVAPSQTGFDPLYLSEFIDIKWAREAELKHGRICMLCAPPPSRGRRGS